MTRGTDAPMPWVIDASAMVDILVGAPRTAEVAKEALRAGHALAAPQVLDLEVVQVLRRWMRAPGADVVVLERAFESFMALNIERHSHAPLIGRVWVLRNNFSAYDAAYVALAEGLGAPLLTSDARLARACEGIVTTIPLQTLSD